MNNLEDYQKLVLIKKDAQQLRSLIFHENEKNDWIKLFVLYAMFLMYQHLYLIYTHMDLIQKSGPYDFKKDFLKIYLLFFFIMNLRGVYGSMIYSIGRLDTKLACSMHQNMGEYFDY